MVSFECLAEYSLKMIKNYISVFLSSCFTYIILYVRLLSAHLELYKEYPIIFSF